MIIEFGKIQGEASKSSFKAFKNDPEKIAILRQAYSHKIIRYLFFKAHNEQLDKLKFSIPYLNENIVNAAIAIVKKELVIERLDDIAEFFNNYSFLPKEGTKNKIPHGALFYGPPGTGKTRLTEDLAELMGFHLISKGVSSSNFMKEYVGGAKGTVEGYFTRANESPHLICSIAIDEIDPLIAK